MVKKDQHHHIITMMIIAKAEYKLIGPEQCDTCLSNRHHDCGCCGS
ncbi:MAG: hypothetical protein ACTSYD_12390 [Candidatus Heimdallarchaeaceae archaeon]